MAKSTTTLEVTIFGAVYRVRGANEGGYLQELATLVDEKMSEVAQHVDSRDVGRVAILAALNLADELVRERSERESEKQHVAERVEQLNSELADALKGAAA